MAYSEDHIALAAEYALGTLDAGERAQVETMMAVDTEFTAIVHAWEYRLGVLNHTRLTVEAIRSAGLQCSLIALNSVQCAPDISQVTNLSLLETLVDGAVVAVEHNQQEFGDLLEHLW